MGMTGTVDALLKAKGHVVWSISPDAMVYDAISMLAEKNVGALMVMEDEMLVGIFSERDYTRKVALLGKNSRTTRVREVLSSGIVPVSLQATVEDCMRLMTEHRIRHLPVVEKNQVLGVLSIGDLVNWIITAQQAKIDQLENYIAGSYPSTTE